MKKNISTLLFGFVFILGGLFYLGNVFLGWDFDLFFDGWWTLFIIVPCFISILSNGPKTGNIIGFLIGVLLLISRQFPYILDRGDTWIAIVATSVIVAGIAMIIGYFRNPNSKPDFQPPMGENQGSAEQPNHKNWSYDTSNFPNYNAILSGFDGRNTSPNFEGARVSAILGGVDLDLRQAVVNHDITVYVTSVLGGVDIFAPQNVRIAISKTDILGSTDCKAYTMPPEAQVPVVTFVCTTIMGGIDIK